MVHYINSCAKYLRPLYTKHNTMNFSNIGIAIIKRDKIKVFNSGYNRYRKNKLKIEN